MLIAVLGVAPLVAALVPGLAARTVEHRRPGVPVLTEQGCPHAVLPASRPVHLLVPGRVVEPLPLAAAVDEAHADRLRDEPTGVQVRACLHGVITASNPLHRFLGNA
ncbi:CBS domain-containing protein [Kitasatospora purpeofusca]|uniref:hypothetical protein n=1 Tax=Kitasatospora purpeofusca TaxID=67352 RepID=UPI00382A1457